jgi:hypothetical protein
MRIGRLAHFFPLAPAAAPAFLTAAAALAIVATLGWTLVLDFSTFLASTFFF